MRKKKLMQILLTALPLFAAVLSALPWTVKLNFAAPDERIVHYYSAFSMMPVGYAVWGAMGGAIGAIVLTVLSVVKAFVKGKNILQVMYVIAIVAGLLALSTALFGNMTLLGGVITMLLTAEAILLHLCKNANQ